MGIHWRLAEHLGWEGIGWCLASCSCWFADTPLRYFRVAVRLESGSQKAFLARNAWPLEHELSLHL